MDNSADPDQLAFSEANWSGSTLFAKVDHIQVQCILSPDSIFSVIFSFLFKGIQSSTAYNDLISYVP